MTAKPSALPNAPTISSSVSRLIQGQGEMAELLRSFDWSHTALGPVESWPGALLVSVNLMLHSPSAIALYWGPERLFLYNDHFRPFTDHRHPACLGQPGQEVWKESWHLLSGQCDAAFAAGQVTSEEDFLVPLEQGGVLQNFYWTYSFVPIWDKGEVAGIFNVCRNTTAHVMAQRHLRESEQRALRVLESIGDAVIVTDVEGRVTRMNPVAEHLTGWGSAQAQGRTLTEVFHIVDEGSRVPLEDPATEVKRLRTVVDRSNHALLLRRDGTAVHIEDSGAPVRDDDGQLTGIVFVFRDVGEKRRLEQERERAAERDRESAVTQELLVQLLQWQRETNDPFAMMLAASEAVGRHLKVDRTGFFEMVDDFTTRLSGCWTAGELPLLSGDVPVAVIGDAQRREARLGRTLAVSDYSTDPRTLDSKFADIGVRAGIGVPIIRKSRWQGGFYVHSAEVREWTEAEVVFVREVAGQTFESVELAVNQQAVRHSEARLRKVLESIGDAVIVTDTQNTVTGLNPIAERLTGWTEQEAQGHSLLEVCVLRHSDAPSGSHISCDENATQAHLVRRSGNELLVEHSCTQMRDDQGRSTGSVLIFRDVTNRETEERRVRQAYKMEALGQLTGGIAHDFNNILGIIMGNLELVAEDLGADPVLQERISQAVASTEKAADLTRRLLAYARQHPLEPAVVDVVHLVHTAAEFIRRSLGPTIALQVNAAEAPWHAHIDRNQFENAILNLALNARDAMPNGGQLQIDCRNTLVTENKNGVPPGEYLEIAVTDTGHGMSHEELLRATEPFFTTKPVGQGTGLGLSMVYGFVKQSGGHMHMESQLTAGTTVILYLPRAASVEPQLAPARARPLPAPLPRGDELVLIVEDELAIRRTIAYLLTSLGYRILQAEDGPAALLHLEQTPGIDLLLTDIVLPNGISGPELAQRAAKLQPEMAAVFTSGYTSQVLVRDYGLQEGAHLLNKPFHLAELARMLRGILNQRRQTRVPSQPERPMSP